MAKYDTAKLQAYVNVWAEYWWAIATATFGKGIGSLPIVEVNPRLTSTAGRAFVEHTPQKVDFSCYLMEKYPEEFEKDTVPHELAHIIAYRLYKDRGHGKAWKYVAHTLYGNSKRCHNMESLHMAKKRAQ